MTTRTALSLVTVGFVSAFSAPVDARAAFDPTIGLSLSSRQAGANPRVDFRYVQDPGEEVTDQVTFVLPPENRLPRDAAIGAGEILGDGKLTTAIAPFCSATFQLTFDAILYERDRTPEEIQQGLWAVWVADLGPVAVEFPWQRLASGRWRAISVVPQSPLVCPPVTLTSTVNRTSAESGTVIVRNPRKPGTYKLKIIARSVQGSQLALRKRIRFH